MLKPSKWAVEWVVGGNLKESVIAEDSSLRKFL